MIEDAIRDVIDEDAFDAARESEDANEARLKEIAQRWPEIEKILDQ